MSNNTISIRERYYSELPEIEGRDVMRFQLMVSSTPKGKRFAQRDASGVRTKDHLSGWPVIKVGDPGNGKSSNDFRLADHIGAPALELQLSRDGILLSRIASIVPVLDEAGNPISEVLDTPPAKVFYLLAEEAKRRGVAPVVVLEDISAAALGDVLAASLGLAQKNTVGSFTLPGNTVIHGSMNPPESAPDGRDIPGAMCGRMSLVWMKDPTPVDWDAYTLQEMLEDYGDHTPEVFDFEAYRSSILAEFMRPDAYPRWRSRVAAWLARRPSAMRTQTKPNQPNAEPRKWDYVARWCGRCAAERIPFARDTETFDPWFVGMASLVGVSEATEALAYFMSEDFPDVMSILEQREMWTPDRHRPDLVCGVAGEIVGVVSSLPKESRGKYADAALSVWESWPDWTIDVVRGPMEQLAALRLLNPVRASNLLRKCRAISKAIGG